MGVHLRVHEVVVAVPGFFVQRLRGSTNRLLSIHSSTHVLKHHSDGRTHLVLCGCGELANQRVGNGYGVVQTPHHVSRGVLLPRSDAAI